MNLVGVAAEAASMRSRWAPSLVPRCRIVTSKGSARLRTPGDDGRERERDLVAAREDPERLGTDLEVHGKLIWRTAAGEAVVCEDRGDGAGKRAGLPGALDRAPGPAHERERMSH